MNRSIDAETVQHAEEGTTRMLERSWREQTRHIGYSIYGWRSVNVFLIQLIIYERGYVELHDNIKNNGTNKNMINVLCVEDSTWY